MLLFTNLRIAPPPRRESDSWDTLFGCDHYWSVPVPAYSARGSSEGQKDWHQHQVRHSRCLTINGLLHCFLLYAGVESRLRMNIIISNDERLKTQDSRPKSPCELDRDSANPPCGGSLWSVFPASHCYLGHTSTMVTVSSNCPYSILDFPLCCARRCVPRLHTLTLQPSSRFWLILLLRRSRIVHCLGRHKCLDQTLPMLQL